MAIAILAKVYLLDETVGWSVIILLQSLFALHLDSILSFLVSFNASPIFSILFALSVLFETFLGQFIEDILKHSNETLRPVILALSSMSPYQPIRLFFNNYSNCHNAKVHHIMAQELTTILAEQIIWIILLRAFAYWFEEVCPWQEVSAVRSPWFCFNEVNSYLNIEDSLENTATTSKYFEQRAQTREVGIKICDVTKVFNNIPVLSDVSFSIYKGEITLLLGHNGAGKTTLMNVLIGLLHPDRGKIRVRQRPDGAASVGVCPQTSIFDKLLTVRQHLELFNDIKSNISGLGRNRHIQQTINDVGLSNLAEKRPLELSGGSRRKLSLALALVGKSDVLILDEPSSGLDLGSRMTIRNVIRKYSADRTVLLSTQHMEDADYLGDRIAIMSGGQIVCCGSSVYLNKLFGTGYKLRIECKPSKTEEILDHIRGYFDCAQVEESMESRATRWSMTDGLVDFVVELKMKDEKGDEELQMIKLLQDIENHASIRGVHLYGLKSPSIEDLILTSRKYFPGPESDSANLNSHASNCDRLGEIVTGHQTKLKIIRAFCTKQLQVFYNQWRFVLLMRVAIPVFASYYFIGSSKPTDSLHWQSPVTALMVVHFVYFPIIERLTKFKIMQLNSSAPVQLYWLSQIIMDLPWVAVCLVSVNIFLDVQLGADFLVSGLHVHLLVFSATLLFCAASMLSCYMLSTSLTNAVGSFGRVVGIFAISTGLLGFIKYLGSLYAPDKLIVFHEAIPYFVVPFIPGDAYSYIRSGLATDCYIGTSKSTENPCIPSTGSSRVMLGFVALAFQALLYAGLLYLIEMHKVDLAWYLRPRNILICILRRARSAASSTSLPVSTLIETDKDVEDENERALLAIKTPIIGSNRSLTAVKLNKSYQAGAKVIEDLSFTVKKGECFGLLGINGTGKSTIFSMLAAEMRPDSGRILANGQYLDEDLHKYRSTLGYDPQSNPEMSLTANQALSLMARLRGVEESYIPALVDLISDLLEMREHMNKLDSQLSGGTKRKLILGMALIGNPSLLLLDKPTVGVDPFARRAMWRLLRSLKERSNVSIVISSHAIEECEAICDRLSILARRRLRCIGTFLHLRTKFARGCTLKVLFSPKSNDTIAHKVDNSTRLADPSIQSMQRSPAKLAPSIKANNLADTNELIELLNLAIGVGNYKLTDISATCSTFKITNNKVKRSLLFETMRKFCEKHSNVSYMINDSSLTDVLIDLSLKR